MILGEALLSAADCSDKTLLYILFAADIIDNTAGKRIHEKGIHGKITAAAVVLRSGKFHMRRPAPVPIVFLAPECGDFIIMSFLNHDHHAKTNPHRHRAGKKRIHLIGLGGRDNIIISGLYSPKEITYTPSHEIGFMT